MNKIRFLFVYLLFSFTATYLLGGIITAISTDNISLQVRREVLEVSETLKNSIGDCDAFSGEVFLGKSAEEFNLILPFLESVCASNCDIQEQLSTKETSVLTRIVEQSDFFHVPQITDPSCNILQQRLTAICKQSCQEQYQEGFAKEVQSFLGSVASLTSYTNKLTARKMIERHHARIWLLRECNIPSQTFSKDTSGLASFSPDGKNVAIGSSFCSTVKILDVQSRNCIASLEDDKEGLDVDAVPLESLSFSPDGNLLATGSEEGTVKIWDLKSKECRYTCNHAACIYSVTFSPDGKLFAAGFNDGTVKIWDVQSGKSIRSLSSDRESVLSAVFSPDSKLLITGSSNGIITIWNVQSGRDIYQISERGGNINKLVFSPDGKCFAYGFENGTVKIRDIQSYNLLRSFKAHVESVISVAFSPDGKYFATGSGSFEGVDCCDVWPEDNTVGPEDNTVKIWDAQTGYWISTLRGHKDTIFSVDFNPDGTLLASGSYDNTTKMWNINAIKRLTQFLSHGITLEQAAMLILFYKNRNNGSFKCPGFFTEHFNLLPDNIKKIVRPLLDKVFSEIFSRNEDKKNDGETRLLGSRVRLSQHRTQPYARGN